MRRSSSSGLTLQHTATHCNTLQHTATHRNIKRTSWSALRVPVIPRSDLLAEKLRTCLQQCVAVCCSVLHSPEVVCLQKNCASVCTTCCTVNTLLQHTITHCNTRYTVNTLLQHKLYWSALLRHVVLQCIVLRHALLQHSAATQCLGQTMAHVPATCAATHCCNTRLCCNTEIQMSHVSTTHSYIFIYIHTHTYTHIYIHICVCAYTCVYVYMYICIHIYIYIHLYKYICICVYIHIYSHYWRKNFSNWASWYWHS